MANSSKLETVSDFISQRSESMKTFFGKRKFDVYTSTELKDLVMEIIDDVYKGDFYNFFRAYARNSEGEIVDRKGVKYEQKFYQETLEYLIASERV